MCGSKEKQQRINESPQKLYKLVIILSCLRSLRLRKKKIFDFALVLKSIISIDLSVTIVGAFPKPMPKNDQISSSLNYALVSVGDKGNCASRIRHLSEPGIQLFLASYFLFPILHKSLSKVQLYAIL